MNLLRIRLFYSYDVYLYLIDVSIKYVVLTFMSTAAYGLTTYRYSFSFQTVGKILHKIALNDRFGEI